VELRRQKMVGGGQRRRSSLGEVIGGRGVVETAERRGSATVVPVSAEAVAADDEGDLFMDVEEDVDNEVEEEDGFEDTVEVIAATSGER
jgi:hypothetical protein